MVDNAGQIHWNLLRILAICKSSNNIDKKQTKVFWFCDMHPTMKPILKVSCQITLMPFAYDFPKFYMLLKVQLRRLTQSLHLLGLQVLNRLKVKGIWIIIFTRHHVNLAQSALFSSFGNSLIHPCFQCSCRYFIFLYHMHYTTPATNSISIHSIHQRLWDRLK